MTEEVYPYRSFKVIIVLDMVSAFCITTRPVYACAEICHSLCSGDIFLKRSMFRVFSSNMDVFSSSGDKGRNMVG